MLVFGVFFLLCLGMTFLEPSQAVSIDIQGSVAEDADGLLEIAREVYRNARRRQVKREEEES